MTGYYWYHKWHLQQCKHRYYNSIYSSNSSTHSTDNTDISDITVITYSTNISDEVISLITLV